MKHKIEKIAFILNIIAQVSIIVFSFMDLSSLNDIVASIFLAVVAVALLTPFVFGVFYLLGSASSEDYMIITSIASVLTSLIASNGKGACGGFAFTIFYFALCAIFALIKHRKKIRAKHVFGALVLAFAIGSIFLALKIENAIRDVKITKYDEQGNVICSESGGVKTLYEYENGRLVKEIRTWESDFPVTVFEYDEKGNKILEKKISKDGEREKTGAMFKYDEKNRLVMSWNDWSEVYKYYFYDEKGQEIKELCDNKETLFEYDEKGNMIKQTDSNGKITHYEYNENGKRIKMLSDSIVIDWEYFEDKPDQMRHSVHKRITPNGELFTSYESFYDRDDNVIIRKNLSSHIERTFYITRRTYWKNGNVKTKRVYDISFRWRTWE